MTGAGGHRRARAAAAGAGPSGGRGPAESPAASATAGRGAGRRRRSSGTGISLNLTPMIDVVFLLLFFFLMVTRFGSREGMLPARLPGRAAAAPAIEIPRVPIRIRFVTDPTTPDQCQVSIDRFHEAPMEIPALASALASIRDNEPGFDDTSVQLVADDDVAWDHVVNAYNAGLAAGYEKIYFVGSP